MTEVWVAAVGAAVSIGSAVSQRNQAKKAAGQQQDAMDAQAEQQAAQLAFAKEQYADWRDMFYPVAGDLRTMAYETQGPDYGAINADVGAAFDTSQDINRRQQQRFGLQPSDGAVQEGELRYGLGRASAMVNARNQARTASKDQQFNKLMSFYGMGSGQGQMAANMVAAAHQGAAAGFGNQANIYGAQSANAQAGFGNSLNSAGNWIGYGLQNANWGSGAGASPIPISGISTVPVSPGG